MRLIRKGTKGKILIPSYLAFGAKGAQPKIAPNSNLVFDIEVIDVVTHKQYQEKMNLQQQQMEKNMQQMQQQQRTNNNNITAKDATLEKTQAPQQNISPKTRNIISGRLLSATK